MPELEAVIVSKCSFQYCLFVMLIICTSAKPKDSNSSQVEPPHTHWLYQQFGSSDTNQAASGFEFTCE